MCFANDPLIFCRVKAGSISIVVDCLKRFKELSTVQFLTQMKATCSLVEFLPMSSHNSLTLPIRYFDVPLISSKLNASDWKVLVEQIVNKANQ